jgi:DNA recombination-dependent growth factor C
LPWDKLWDEGLEGATKALARLRNGEKILPGGLSREALEAYREIALRALANPVKANEVQRIRLQVIEELLKGMEG